MATPSQDGNTRRRLRLAGRWLVLAAALALAWPGRTQTWTSVLLPSLSPFVALGSALASRSVNVLILLSLPVLVLALLSPRWFCRCACPVGLLQENLERLRPSASPRWGRWPALGKWAVLFTLGGACLGYPFLLWLDPLALFHGFLNAWRQPLASLHLVAGLGLLLLLLLDLAAPRLWCQRLCPLGATQELLALPRRRLRSPARCDEGATADSATARPAAVARRSFLAAGAGAAGAFALRSARGQSPPLRPPGALEEARFSGVCIRCGNCAQACPSRIIQPNLGRSGLVGFLTPVLRFDEDYCREGCHRCHEVCPSGAIARLTLTEKRRRVIGPARVDLDTCLLANGRECTACIQRCPYEAIALQTSADGFSTLPRVDLQKCTGCGACEAVCPVRPVRAVRVATGPGVLGNAAS